MNASPTDTPSAARLPRALPAPLWIIRSAAERLTAEWRALATIIVGVFLTAAIAAAMPLYSAALTQYGTVQRIESRPPADTSIFIRTSLPAPDVAGRRAALDALIAEQSAASIKPYGDWLRATHTTTESSDLFIVLDGVDAAGLKARLAAYDGVADAVDWEGRPPTATADPMEVALSDLGAERLDVGVGDRLTLDQRGWETSQPIDVEVVGIWTPAESDGWRPLPSRAAQNEVAVLVDRDALVRVATQNLPDTRLTMAWWLVFDPSALPFTELIAAAESVASFGDAAEIAFTSTLGAASSGVVVQTRLPEVLRGAGANVAAIGVPTVIILLMVGVLVLYFLLVMGALTRRRERRELSVLQTRGALRRQILVMRGVEAALISGAAALAAPIAARAFLLVFIPLVTGVERLRLDLTADAYVFSAVAAAAAFAVQLVTMWGPLNLPLIDAGGARRRSDVAATFQRYYLDIVLLVVGLAALIQLSAARDSTTDRGDPLLLLVPALLLFALSSLALRLFPVLTSALSRLLTRSSALPAGLAGWQISREPLHYARLTLLLALAVVIGWFGTTYRAVVEDNRVSQAEYAVGADVRLTYGRSDLPPVDAISRLEGTSAVSRVLRLDGISLAPGGSVSLDTGTLLAVEPAAFESVVRWRDDLGPLPLPSAANFPPVGRILPEGATSIVFEARLAGVESQSDAQATAALVTEMRFSAILRDSAGRYQTVPFAVDVPETIVELANRSPFQTEGVEERDRALAAITWIQYRADLPESDAGWTLIGIGVESGGDRSLYFASGATLGLRGFQFDGADAAGDWFSSGWSEAGLTGVNMEPLGGGPDAPEGSVTSVTWEQAPAPSPGQWVLYVDGADYAAIVADEENAQQYALSALVSPAYAAQNELEPGDLFSLGINRAEVWLRVDGVAPFVPTLDAGDGLVVVTDLDGLEQWLGSRPRSAVQPGEAWVRLDPSVDAATWTDALESATGIPAYSESVSIDSVLETVQADLLTTGLIGLLLLGFVVALVLAVFSLIAYAAITLQSRQREFAVLRALGWGRRLVVASIVVEQAVVAVVGIALGQAIGIFLSGQVLPLLAGAEPGNALPYAIRQEPVAVLAFAGVMLAVLAVQVAVSGLLIVRQGVTAVREGGLE
ncbi:MAG: FtsX-like permease family protein [Chloroflexi bacterium]|nr:FtsX-like permease family protein [Chloroflexota bacterium]